MVHVPYKGGAPATTNVLAGQVQMYFGNAAELLPHIGNKKVKLILVSRAARMPQLPDTPTLAELFLRLQTVVLERFYCPGRNTEAHSRTRCEETAAAAKDATISQRLMEIGIEPGGLMLDDFQKDIEQSRAAFEEAVKAAGMKSM